MVCHTLLAFMQTSTSISFTIEVLFADKQYLTSISFAIGWKDSVLVDGT